VGAAFDGNSDSPAIPGASLQQWYAAKPPANAETAMLRVKQNRSRWHLHVANGCIWGESMVELTTSCTL